MRVSDTEYTFNFTLYLLIFKYLAYEGYEKKEIFSGMGVVSTSSCIHTYLLEEPDVDIKTIKQKLLWMLKNWNR